LTSETKIKNEKFYQHINSKNVHYKFKKIFKDINQFKKIKKFIKNFNFINDIGNRASHIKKV